MKETGVLFQGSMVRSLVADIKTMTRRAVKWKGLQPGLNMSFSGLSVERSGSNWVLSSPTRTSHEYRCLPTPFPCGQVGDRIWVRETFFAFGRWETRFNAKKGRDEWHFVDMTLECGHAYQYAADNPDVPLDKGRGVLPGWYKRPAIFMPRAASRITLEITEIRIERLQDISEADAAAEGLEKMVGAELYRAPLPSAAIPRWCTTSDAYRDLWESINGERTWAANPYVWVIYFRRVKS